MSEQKIAVVGCGSVSNPPDELMIRFRVNALQSDAKLAQEEVKKKSSILFDGLIGVGMNKEEITTDGYSVKPEYDWESRHEKTFKGFEASNWITIYTKKLDKVGEILEVIVGCGVSEIGQVSFRTKDWQKASYKALREAARDARLKAEAIAEGLGVGVGPVLEVSTTHREYNHDRLWMSSNYLSFANESKENDWVATPDQVFGGAVVMVTFAINEAK